MLSLNISIPTPILKAALTLKLKNFSPHFSYSPIIRSNALLCSYYLEMSSGRAHLRPLPDDLLGLVEYAACVVRAALDANARVARRELHITSRHTAVVYSYIQLWSIRHIRVRVRVYALVKLVNILNKDKHRIVMYIRVRTSESSKSFPIRRWCATRRSYRWLSEKLTGPVEAIVQSRKHTYSTYTYS